MFWKIGVPVSTVSKAVLVSQAASQFKAHKIEASTETLETIFKDLTRLYPDDNKSIVNFVKKGLEAKASTSAIYEVLSNLSGHSSWNVASAAKEEFKNMFIPEGVYWKELKTHLTEAFKNLSMDRFNAMEEILLPGLLSCSVENTFVWVVSILVHNGARRLLIANPSNRKGISHSVRDIINMSDSMDLSIFKRIMIASSFKNEIKRPNLHLLDKYLYEGENDFSEPIKTLVEGLEKENNLENMWRKMPGYPSLPLEAEPVLSKDLKNEIRTIEKSYGSRIYHELSLLPKNKPTSELFKEFQNNFSWLSLEEVFSTDEFASVYSHVENSMRANPVVFEGKAFFDAEIIFSIFKLIIEEEFAKK